MCLLAFAVDQSRKFPFVVASNRDEFFTRPTARLGWWTTRSGSAHILGGRDLESGGTWLGLTAEGRLAMLTNVRSAQAADPRAPSRGRIVTDWLEGREDTGDFWMRTALSGHNGFNLVAADFARGECFWASNISADPRRLDRGTYGLSNGALDAPWPKAVALKAALDDAIAVASDAEALASRLFAALTDRRVAPDGTLPQTGIPLARERALSPAFIHLPEIGYGTRCSTLIIADRSGREPVTHVFERGFDGTGAPQALRRTTLTHWPPRYVRTDLPPVVERAEVIERSPEAGTIDEPPRGRRSARPAVDKRRGRGLAAVA